MVDEDLDGVITSVNGNVVSFRDEFGFIHQYKKEKLVLKNTDFYKDISTERKAEPNKPKSQKNAKSGLVLDLHFDQLVKNSSEYDSFERLFLQKEKLIQTIEFCRENKIKRLEIIHGIGDGVLQQMVFDVLKSQINLEFEDHDFFYHSSGSVVVNFR